jgi:hypothetical protein
MKKLLLAILATTCISAQAAGIITHNLFADKSVTPTTTPKMQEIIQQYSDDFLVGSDYPDTGYAFGATYGEDTHWAPFMNAFLRHLDDKGGIENNPRLAAFLFGIHSHNASDIIWHWGFISYTADCSNRDWQKIHSLADTDLELAIASQNYKLFPSTPKWKVPVNDLVAIYQRMGKNYTAEEIIHSNRIYHLATIAEHIGIKSRLLRFAFIKHAKRVFPECGYSQLPKWLEFTYKEVESDRELLWNAALTGGNVVDYPKPYSLVDNGLAQRINEKLMLKVNEEMLNWITVEQSGDWYQFSFDEKYRNDLEKWVREVIEDWLN